MDHLSSTVMSEEDESEIRQRTTVLCILDLPSIFHTHGLLSSVFCYRSMDENALPPDVNDSNEGWTPYYPSSLRVHESSAGPVLSNPDGSVLTGQSPFGMKDNSKKRELDTASFEQADLPWSSNLQPGKTLKDSRSTDVSTIKPDKTADNILKPPPTDILVVSEKGKWCVYEQRRFNTLFRDRTTSQWQFSKAYTDDTLRYLAEPRVNAKTASSMVPGILTAFEKSYKGAMARQKQAAYRSFRTNDWNDPPFAPKDS